MFSSSTACANWLSREQILLEDDPIFSADLNMPAFNIDIFALEMSATESSRQSSVLSQRSRPSSHSSQHSGRASSLGLVIPSSGGGSFGDLGGQLPSDQPSSAQRIEQLGRLLDDDDDAAFNFDPGFSIDAQGNLIEDSGVSGVQVRDPNDAEFAPAVTGPPQPVIPQVSFHSKSK